MVRDGSGDLEMDREKPGEMRHCDQAASQCLSDAMYSQPIGASGQLSL